ncbi:MAG: diguanylate cyclase [Myxococcota bacterium]
MDDDPTMHFVVRRSLSEGGFQVETCAGARDALRRLSEAAFDVVVTDLSMPGIDGLGLVEAVRRIRPEMAFIVVTGRAELELGEGHAGDPAIVGVLQKPWERRELLELLKHASRRVSRVRRRISSVPEGSPAHHPPILLVEDDPQDAFLLQRLFARSDLARPVEHVERLADAEARLARGAYSAVFTDLSLPDALGLDCVRRLRQANDDVPLVVISGSADLDLATLALEAGAHEYLSKDAADAGSLSRAHRFAKARRRSERKLADRAHYDPLTGLANRSLFGDLLGRSLREARRHEERVGLLYLDLDGFKAVNDTQGHAAGDAVLRHVARRLEAAVRVDDSVARLGGDEFAIILHDVHDERAAASLRERVRESLATPAKLPAGPYVVRASIGLALSVASDTSEELIRRADGAMYRVKSLSQQNTA